VYHFAPAGSVRCDYGHSVAQPLCALAIGSISTHTPGRGMQVGSGGSCNDRSWGSVPRGCSVQSGGDWTAHYKTSGTVQDGCAHNMYQLVCDNSPKLGVLGANGCSEGLTVTECEIYANKDSSLHWHSVVSWSDYPKGCFWYSVNNYNVVGFNKATNNVFAGNTYVYFNTHATGGGNPNAIPVCKTNVSAVAVELGVLGANGCSEYFTASECEDYAQDDSSLTWKRVISFNDYPKGCFWYTTNNGVYFNRLEGAGDSYSTPVCKTKLRGRRRIQEAKK